MTREFKGYKVNYITFKAGEIVEETALVEAKDLEEAKKNFMKQHNKYGDKMAKSYEPHNAIYRLSNVEFFKIATEVKKQEAEEIANAVAEEPNA